MTKEEILGKLGDRREHMERALQNTAPKQPELRIAILSCSKTMRRCVGRSCIWAFQDKERHFSIYRNRETPVRLCAFFNCNGCDANYESDPDFRKKIERLVLDDVRVIHLSSCMTHHCSNLQKIQSLIESYGLQCEMGTH